MKSVNSNKEFPPIIDMNQRAIGLKESFCPIRKINVYLRFPLITNYETLFKSKMMKNYHLISSEICSFSSFPVNNIQPKSNDFL